MFSVFCDNCGLDSSKGCDYAGWNDKGFAVDCAIDAGFEAVADLHYCPKCFEYDDNDNLVVKPAGVKEWGTDNTYPKNL